MPGPKDAAAAVQAPASSSDAQSLVVALRKAKTLSELVQAYRSHPLDSKATPVIASSDVPAHAEIISLYEGAPRTAHPTWHMLVRPEATQGPAVKPA
jgi:hypothetical protein